MNIKRDAACFAGWTMTLGLAVAATIIGAEPAAAQTPFIKTIFAPSCSSTATGTACVFEFDAVPQGERQEIAHIACRTNLLNPDVSRESADLAVRNASNKLIATVPLSPVNTTNSNIWVISEETFIPVGQNRKAVITIQSFEGKIVGNVGVCTISGTTESLP